MRFIRKNGRIIPIRDKNDRQDAKIVAGGAVATAGLAKTGVKARSFSADFYRAGPLKLVTMTPNGKLMPRGAALVRKNSVGGDNVMFAASSSLKKRTGLGKKLFAAVQFDAARLKRDHIAGMPITSAGMEFMRKQGAVFHAGGRVVDGKVASKAMKKGLWVKGFAPINLKNRSYAAMGLKKAWRPNKALVALGLGLAAHGLWKRLKNTGGGR